MGRVRDMRNTPLKQELDKRQINIEELLKDYSKGMGEGHIRIKYKISENVLKSIIKEYCNNNIEKKRQAQHEKWKIDVMNDGKKEVKTPKVSLSNAIKGVEVEGDER